MSEQPAIEVRGLSKKFSRSLKRAMWYGLMDIVRAAVIPHRFRSPNLAARMSDALRQAPAETGEPIGQRPETRDRRPETGDRSMVSGLQSTVSSDGLRPSEFWALRDVSFEVRRGECLGVVGHNGAGKSTLFSILSGIYGPTEGRAEIRGRLQALIALGAGFHPMLSGRENIFINGAILGLRDREIRRKFDSILEFSELGDFIDMPVKNYSSGMYVRLGFSVAVHMEPDILLVDEVLAVGDLAFQNKSFERIKSLLDRGVPMMFVSHSPTAVEMVATHVMWLDRGKPIHIGPTRQVLTEYANYMCRISKPASVSTPEEISDLHPARVTRAELLSERGDPVQAYTWNQPIRIRLHIENLQEGLPGYLSLWFQSHENYEGRFCVIGMLDDGLAVRLPRGKSFYDCLLPAPRISAGFYDISAGIQRAATASVGQDYFQFPVIVATLEIRATPPEMGLPGLPFSLAPYLPPIVMDHVWLDDRGGRMSCHH